MKTYGSVKAGGSALVLMGVLMVFTACGGSGGGSSDGGSVVFSLALQNTPAGNAAVESELAQAEFPCAEQAIAAIEAELLKNEATEAEGGPFDCEEGEGSIEEVPPGSNYTLIVTARDGAGTAIFSGEADGLRVTAGQTTDAGTVTLNRIRNRPPVLAAISDQTVFAGGQVVVNLSATDRDQGDVLTFAAELSDDVSNPFQVLVQNNGDGTAVCTLSANSEAQAGSFTFRFTVTDDGELEPGALSDSQDVAIILQARNRPPVLSAIGSRTEELGQPIVIAPSATDPDGDPLAYTVQWIGAAEGVLPGNAVFNRDEGGVLSFRWTPLDDSGLGVKTFRFTVTDNSTAPPGPLSDFEDVVITVEFGPS